MNDLHDLFIETLRRTFYATTAITRAVPILMEAVDSTELLAVLSEHFEETKMQAIRLREMFSLMNVTPAGEECQAINGHLFEADQLISKSPLSPVLDAGVLASLQAIQHYEISRYGTLRAWAAELGLHDVRRLLQRSLSEVRATGARLSLLALTHGHNDAEAQTLVDDSEPISASNRSISMTLKITGWRQTPAFTGL